MIHLNIISSSRTQNFIIFLLLSQRVKMQGAFGLRYSHGPVKTFLQREKYDSVRPAEDVRNKTTSGRH